MRYMHDVRPNGRDSTWQRLHAIGKPPYLNIRPGRFAILVFERKMLFLRLYIVRFCHESKCWYQSPSKSVGFNECKVFMNLFSSLLRSFQIPTLGGFRRCERMSMRCTDASVRCFCPTRAVAPLPIARACWTGIVQRAS